jgi:hypothetical protein
VRDLYFFSESLIERERKKKEIKNVMSVKKKIPKKPKQCREM